MSEHESQELDFTPVEGEHPVPVGWRILFWGLVVFGAVYLVAFSPWGPTHWSQAAGLSEAAPGSGGNVAATILFTAAAAIAAGAILFGVTRRKK